MMTSGHSVGTEENTGSGGDKGQKKRNRKKPKNYHWTQKGSKASRRKTKQPGVKNTIVGEVVQLKRPKNKASAKLDQAKIKQLARTGRIKSVASKPSVRWLINLSIDMNQEGTRIPDEASNNTEEVEVEEVSDVNLNNFKNVTSESSAAAVSTSDTVPEKQREYNQGKC